MILNKGQNVKNLILPIFEIDNRLNINRVTSERQKRIALQLALARKFGTKYLENFDTFLSITSSYEIICEYISKKNCAKL